MGTKGYLIIEDGTVVEGELFGYVENEKKQEVYGEIVFNTSMTGYQEIVTDPSYASQVIVFTYPEIGNYGINDDDSESTRIWANGIVVKNLCKEESHYKAKMSLEEFLKENKKIGIKNVDTRSITKKISTKGTMKCVITNNIEGAEEIKEKLKTYKMPTNLVEEVSIKDVENYKRKGEIRVGLIDLGVKKNIIRELIKREIDVTVFPYDAKSEDILKGGYDGLLISNGPGDPKDCIKTIEMVRKLIGKIPIFGICLGYQILAIVLGAKTYKLKFGHRGGNHPCINTITNKVIMTSQNHGYAVKEDSLPDYMKITYKNLNDGTLEGFINKELNIEAVQFHPEAQPGPYDAEFIFDNWIKKLTDNKNGINISEKDLIKL